MLKESIMVYYAILAPGGAVIAYKDEQGVVHSVVPANAKILYPGEKGYQEPFIPNDA